MPTKPNDDQERVWPRPEIVVPNPDPSAVTIQHVDREIKNLSEQIDARLDGMEKAVQVFHDDLVRVPTQTDRAIAGLRELLETRMDGMDAVAQLLKERVEGKNGGLDDEIKHLRELMQSTIDEQSSMANQKFASIEARLIERRIAFDTRFAAIDIRFGERDKRSEQLTLADKTAVAAALQAAKEMVGAQNTSNNIAIAKSEASTAESIKQLQTLFTTANSALTVRVDELKGRLDRGEGRTSISEPGTSDEISKLRAAILNLATSRDTMVGHAQGVSQTTAMLIAIGGALSGAAIALISKFM